VNVLTDLYNAGLVSGDMSGYKSACYALRCTVRTAKQQYRERVESHFQLNASRRIWQGLRTISSVKSKPSVTVSADSSLANELNTFNACFEANCSGDINSPSTCTEEKNSCISDACAITVSEDEVHQALKLVNIRKAAGPDKISGRVLRSCADQLAGLFTSIFNEFLVQSVVPTCFKISIIIPVPKNNNPSSLSDCRPVAITSLNMKVSERLIKNTICSSIPNNIDPLQFALIGLLRMLSPISCMPLSPTLTAIKGTM